MTRMVVVVVLVFAGCWLPFLHRCHHNLALRCPRLPPAGATSSWLCCPMPTAGANPLLYGFLSRQLPPELPEVLCLRSATVLAPRMRMPRSHVGPEQPAAGGHDAHAQLQGQRLMQTSKL